MKTTLPKLTAACALALAMAPGAQAQILANDPFGTAGGYTAGSILGQNPTTTGFTGAWNSNFGSGANATATPLTYTAPTGYFETTGAGTMVDGASGNNQRSLASSVTTAFGASSGSLYLSFELQLAGGTAGYQAFELYINGTRALQVGASSFGDFANSANFGIRLNDNGATQGAFGALDTSTHLFVLQFNLAAGTSLNAWEDPTDLSGLAPTGGTEVSLTGLPSLAGVDRLNLSDFGSANLSLSEVRMGDTLANITGAAPVPEPSAACLASLGLGALFLFRRRVTA
jgi:hypothetical protein